MMKEPDTLHSRDVMKGDVTKDDLCHVFAALGMKTGDNVMVHSSLSSFGRVEGGADTVIDALLETVGSEGTIVMPTFSVNRIKHDEFTEEILPFDPSETPVWTGTVAERFRKRPGVIRSTHPTHSLAALGPRGKKLVASLEHLVNINGYVLLLGVNLEANSTMHIAEAIANPPQVKERVSQSRQSCLWGITQRIRLLLRPVEKTFPSLGHLRRFGKAIRDRYVQPPRKKSIRNPGGPWADLTKMESIYLETGIMKMAHVGNAACRLLESRPMIDLFVDALKKDPDSFYTYRPSTYDMFSVRKKA
jgi:aminoglycoside 3-N-acetyltransferase